MTERNERFFSSATLYHFFYSSFLQPIGLNWFAQCVITECAHMTNSTIEIAFRTHDRTRKTQKLHTQRPDIVRNKVEQSYA